MVKAQINKKDNTTYNLQEDIDNLKGCNKDMNKQTDITGVQSKKGAIYAKSPEPYYDPTEYTPSDYGSSSYKDMRAVPILLEREQQEREESIRNQINQLHSQPSNYYDPSLLDHLIQPTDQSHPLNDGITQLSSDILMSRKTRPYDEMVKDDFVRDHVYNYIQKHYDSLKPIKNMSVVKLKLNQQQTRMLNEQLKDEQLPKMSKDYYNL